MVGVLYEVEPIDLPTFEVVAMLLAVTALFACLVGGRFSTERMRFSFARSCVMIAF